MKKYQAVRISKNGRATYGDLYATISGDFQYNDIVEIGDEKYIILFEIEGKKSENGKNVRKNELTTGAERRRARCANI